MRTNAALKLVAHNTIINHKLKQSPQTKYNQNPKTTHSLSERYHHPLKKRFRGHIHHCIRNRYGKNIISTDLPAHKSEQINENNFLDKEQLCDLQQPLLKTMQTQV